jgi:hypothetical protein
MSGDFFKALFEHVKFNLFVVAICLTGIYIYFNYHIAIAGIIALCLAIYLVLLFINFCWEKYQHKVFERNRERANAEYQKQKEDRDNMMIDIWFEAARPMLKEQLIALMNFRSKYDAPNIKFSDGKSLYLNDSECYINSSDGRHTIQLVWLIQNNVVNPAYYIHPHLYDLLIKYMSAQI